jgi:hypothetical protein
VEVEENTDRKSMVEMFKGIEKRYREEKKDV